MGLTKIILDTNAYAALLKGDQQILKLIKEAQEVILPAFVIAELLFGLKKGTQTEKNLEILADFESYPKVRRHYPGAETLQIFAELMLQLRTIGRRIPTHDIWIAAISIESGGTLITYDRHFDHITGLRRWQAS
ncbi:type II toxin-antitoxin system VapC family toxin [Lewinella sp. LCG006]|uniref:type II toxin-antitoxin system VapC family toxin n=1 Tax=Lewinella sp. LCG006 TaxID=3231911 RepID=UPI0034600012